MTLTSTVAVPAVVHLGYDRVIQACEGEARVKQRDALSGYATALAEAERAGFELERAKERADHARDVVALRLADLDAATDQVAAQAHRAGRHEGQAGHTIDECKRPGECGK